MGERKAPGGISAPLPVRYRCKKGHVTKGAARYFLAGRDVQYCPECWLDLLARECGIEGPAEEGEGQAT